MRKKLLLSIGALVLALVGGRCRVLRRRGGSPQGALDTLLAGVSLVTPTGVTSAVTVPGTATVSPSTIGTTAVDEEGPCWPEFGGDPQRTLARPEIQLGDPGEKPLWVRGMGSYMEYPPSFCDGTLYVNTFGGRTAAIEAETGRVMWSRAGQGQEAVDPGDRRTAPDRQLRRRVGHGARSDEREGAVAAADEREGRVLAGRRRRHGLLRRH